LLKYFGEVFCAPSLLHCTWGQLFGQLPPPAAPSSNYDAGITSIAIYPVSRYFFRINIVEEISSIAQHYFKDRNKSNEVFSSEIAVKLTSLE